MAFEEAWECDIWQTLQSVQRRSFVLVSHLAHVVKHAHRRARVEVAAELKGINHRLAAGDMSEEAEFELAVIRHDEKLPWLRAERCTDLVLVLLKRWLVLQVGRACREAPRLRVEIERAVDARVLIGHRLQRQDEVGEHRIDR